MEDLFLKDQYKFNEEELIRELILYVNSTYSQHYSRNKFQATEFIVDSGHGIGFTIGNILKYSQRYGKKGTREDARKDLLKVLHYTLLALYTHDLQDKQLDELEKYIKEGISESDCDVVNSEDLRSESYGALAECEKKWNKYIDEKCEVKEWEPEDGPVHSLELEKEFANFVQTDKPDPNGYKFRYNEDLNQIEEYVNGKWQKQQASV